MKRKIISIFVLGILFFTAGCASFSVSGERYRSGVDSVRNGQPYFAFMHFSTVLKEEPLLPSSANVAFAVGEYYFDNMDYQNALKVFSDYISNHPKHKGVAFAKLIVYKIMTSFKKEEVLDEQEKALIKETRKELFSQPLFIIFYDKKAPRSYKSLFNNSYLVYDYVDRIKVFRNGKTFLELSP